MGSRRITSIPQETPLFRPAIITVAIFEFMHGEHDFTGPLVYLRNPDLYTLSVGLRLYFTRHGAD